MLMLCNKETLKDGMARGLLESLVNGENDDDGDDKNKK